MEEKFGRLGAVAGRTLQLNNRLQGVVEGHQERYEQLQAQVAALQLQRDDTARAHLAAQEKLQQQLADQASMIAELR